MLTTPRLVVECGNEFKVRVLPEGRVELVLDNANVAPVDEVLYDKKGVAARLGATVRSIENWMNKKTHPLPFIRHCGHPRFRESDVRWWLSQGCSVASRRNGCNI